MYIVVVTVNRSQNETIKKKKNEDKKNTIQEFKFSK